jgi:predicted RNA-binding Zn-ribbon protein involved in translation (DUF1610 family)
MVECPKCGSQKIVSKARRGRKGVRVDLCERCGFSYDPRNTWLIV